MRMSSTLALTSLVLPLALLMGGCSSDEHASAPAQAPREVPASVEAARLVEMPTLVPAAGSVVAVDSVQLSSRVMGYIRDLKVVEGQAVKQGELLFVLDPVDVQGAVTQAQQGLLQAEAALKDAKADYERFEQLYKDEVVNRQQFEKMKLNYEVAKSRVAQARAGLTQARGQFEYTRVTSPINGVVTAKFANEGDMANPGQPVVTVEDSSRLQVQTSVSEALFRQLKLGVAVQVEVDGQPQPLTATVARLSPAADPVAHTYPVKLDIAAPGLKSGSFARVLFQSGSRQVLAVPAGAVVERAGIRGVFAIDAQGLAQFRMVRTGSRVNGQVEILAGLAEGERVVTEGVEQVQNGDRPVPGSTNGVRD
ncbi:MAG TPA: efflux RND transporter periplasmic adaptor subunit [Chromatiales bacterium]|nr:efflux RND transporter periplasmic adaptor subunit [Chromatiales bacterium]